MDQKTPTENAFLKGFIAGVIVGVVITLLFTTKKGREVIATLKGKSADFLDDFEGTLSKTTADRNVTPHVSPAQTAGEKKRSARPRQFVRRKR